MRYLREKDMLRGEMVGLFLQCMCIVEMIRDLGMLLNSITLILTEKVKILVVLVAYRSVIEYGS